MTMLSESLLKKYLASSYRIEAPGGQLILHVGVRSEDLAALQRMRGVASSTFITAWNPGSEALDEAENRRRNEALAREASAAGFDLLRASGHSPDRDWCEESYLILGITRGDALALARKYGQVAFLFMGRDAVPELVVCANEPA
jgi:hypothetical protein